MTSFSKQKANFSPQGTEKNLLYTERRPIYPGSHLYEVFLPEKGKKVQETSATAGAVPLIHCPT